MSEDEPGDSRLHRAMLRILTNALQRHRQLEAEGFERMRFPANMGWFEGDTEPVEINYIMLPDGEVLRLIADQAEPWVKEPTEEVSDGEKE